MAEPRVPTNELAQACARTDDPALWDELLRRCSPLVALVVQRTARMWVNNLSSALIDDIVQEVFLKLCEHQRRILREFLPRGDDSFLGLLRIMAASVANDHFRRLYAARRGGKVVTDSLSDETPPAAGDDAQSPHGMHQSVLLAELDQRLRTAGSAISERDRTIFWLYYRQGFTSEEIARIFQTGLSAKGVESALRRVTLWIRSEIEKQRPRVHPDCTTTDTLNPIL